MYRRLQEDIHNVMKKDPAARSRWEVLCCYPGIHALMFYYLSHGMWRRGYHTFARFIAQFGRLLTGIEIHPGAMIGRRLFIDHGMGVVIGETAEVGDDCTLYQGVTLGGTSLARKKRHPTLENEVVIGAGAKVLGSFTVGRGAKIGSNAVVTKPVPAGATVIGNPGRVIKIDPQDCPPVMNDHEDFSAYGIARNIDDPLVEVIRELLQHAQRSEQRLSALLAKLNEAGLCGEELMQDMPFWDKKNLEGWGD